MTFRDIGDLEFAVYRERTRYTNITSTLPSGSMGYDHSHLALLPYATQGVAMFAIIGRKVEGGIE